MKLYGLRYLENEASCWSDFYAFSYEQEKLTAMCKGVSGWHLGAKDVTNNPKEICYTCDENYPRYSVVEVPFII